jgi:hypothetical protein
MDAPQTTATGTEKEMETETKTEILSPQATIISKKTTTMITKRGMIR